MAGVRIAVVGSLNLDLVARGPDLPRPGQTVLGETFSTVAGGKGANQAVAAARLGAAVAMIGCVGSDPFGPTLRTALQEQGVDTAGVRRVTGSTGVALIAVDAGGANQIVVVPGANGHLTTLTTEDRRRISEAHFLLVQLEVPLSVVQDAVACAAAARVPVLLNPAPARPLPETLLERVSWLLPNETELEVLSGVTPATPGAAARAAGMLLSAVPNVVVTMGEQGALWAHRGGHRHVPAIPTAVVDTTAAGDTFCGALAVSLAEGMPPELALDFATAAASICVSRPGAQPSMPSRAEVEALLMSQGRQD